MKAAVRICATLFALALSSLMAVASPANLEALERFELDSLQFYSSSEWRNCGWQVSVIDPDGYLHYVRVGNYLGKHKGQIKKISADTVWIEEVLPDAKGELNLQMTTRPVPKGQSEKSSK